MCAPRALASSRSSRKRLPAPSPRTNPSRVASNGRDTVCGASPGRGMPIPRMFEKPAWPTSSRGDSVEPAMTAMQSPRRMASAASPTLWVPVAHADTMHTL